MELSSLKDPNKVLIYDPDGKPGIILRSSLQSAIDQGFRVGTEEEVSKIAQSLQQPEKGIADKEQKEGTSPFPNILDFFSRLSPSQDMKDFSDESKAVVSSPSGIYVLPKEQLPEAIKNGATELTGEQRLALYAQAKEKDMYEGVLGTAAATAVSALGGATFGGSTLEMSKPSTFLKGAAAASAAVTPMVGPGALIPAAISAGLSEVIPEDFSFVSPKTLEKLRKHNETVSTVSEIAGAVLPALISGGTSAGASGVKGLASYAPTSIVSSIGGQTAKAIEKKVIDLIIGKVSEETGKQVAKKIAAHALAKGVGYATAGAAESALYGVAQSNTKLALGEYDKLSPHEIADNYLYDAGMAALFGAGISGTLGIAGAAVPDMISQATKSKLFSFVATKLEAAGLKSQEEIKSRMFPTFEDAPADTIKKLFGKPSILGTVDSKTNKVVLELENMPFLKDMKYFTEKDRGNLVTKFKDLLSPRIKVYNELFNNFSDAAENSILSRGESLASNKNEYFAQIQKELTDLFGNDVMNAYKNFVYARRPFNNAFGIPGSQRGYNISTDKINTYFKKYTDMFEPTNYGIIKNYDSAAKNLLTAIENNVEKNTKNMYKYLNIKGIYNDINNLENPKYMEAIEKIIARDNLYKLYHKNISNASIINSILTTGIGALAGGAISGPVGAAIGGGGAAIGGLLKPFVIPTLIKGGKEVFKKFAPPIRSQLEIENAIEVYIPYSVGKFFNKTNKLAAPLAPHIKDEFLPAKPVKNDINANIPTKITGKTEEKTIENIENIKNYLSNDVAVNGSILEATEPIRSMLPNTADQLVMRGLAAREFLNSKVPHIATLDELKGTKRLPGTMELRKFQRYMTYTLHPSIIFDDMKRGIVTAEAAEVLRNIYPELYRATQIALVNHMSKKNISRQQRAQILSLFKINELNIVEPNAEEQEQQQKPQGGRPVSSAQMKRRRQVNQTESERLQLKQF